jgi:hypothetical protein
MSKLGPEYVGKLPPGRKDDLERALKDYRLAAVGGIVKGIEILGCSDRAASCEQDGVVNRIDSVPSLPLSGCVRSPCCGCSYVGKT